MPEALKAEMPVLMDILGGFERSAVVLGAAQLDLFSPLGNGPATAAEVAAQPGLPVRGVERVLNTCAALGFVVKEGDRYRNSPLADAFLVKGRPGYVGNLIKQTADRYGAGLAQRIGSLVDLSGCRSLLDVAGGSGVYSILFCRQFPQLKATVFDLPPILQRTRQILAREGMMDRISIREGNYFTDDFGSGLDAILLSNMLQTEGRQTCRMVLKKAFAALNPGGKILVHGIMPNPDRVSPLQPVLFSMFMMLVFPEGEAYPGEEIIDWLHETGFVEGQKLTLPPPAFTSLVVARKPA